jgi:hypothetical protein
MIYETRQAAIDARDMLNRRYGYAPAYVYSRDGAFTVIVTYDCRRMIDGWRLDD